MNVLKQHLCDVYAGIYDLFKLWLSHRVRRVCVTLYCAIIGYIGTSATYADTTHADDSSALYME